MVYYCKNAPAQSHKCCDADYIVAHQPEIQMKPVMRKEPHVVYRPIKIPKPKPPPLVYVRPVVTKVTKWKQVVEPKVHYQKVVLR